MSEPLVVARDVKKVFVHEGKDVDVLKGVDLSVNRGEMLCVVGPSGTGKSTLLHILGTLDLPTSGSITYEGRDVTRLTSSELARFRNRTLGFVFQFHHLMPEFDALENVMMPGLVQGLARTPLKKRARELLEEVGLAHRLAHRPGELSGGEQQRVALARALVLDPALILADEPTGNLDSRTSEQVHQLFFELNARRGTTFLIVTHSRDMAARMPRVVTMRDGVVERDERKSETYRDRDGRKEAALDVLPRGADAIASEEPSEDAEKAPSEAESPSPAANEPSEPNAPDEAGNRA
ncbi:MAG: ABC transporter ATP-binding protein [Sandaracinus sp.]|nr:ABC transporter ATP-binding protein [Sandaracinus sp.]MCB9619042.1 ABC transporter ATP-binding protein [Sandaracinus sp.]